MGCLTCRRCGARIGLPHIKHSRQVPPVFAATCPRCGKASTYSYVDLKDARIPTVEEYLRHPSTRLRLLPDLTMFAYGVSKIQESIVYALRRIREEPERGRMFTERKPATPGA